MGHDSTDEWGIAKEAALLAVSSKELGGERLEPEIERWCAQSDEHLIEFLRARAIYSDFDALKDTSPSFQRSLAASQQKRSAKVLPFRQAEAAPVSSPAQPRPVTASSRRSALAGWLGAAAALAIVALGICLNPGAFAKAEGYATVIGQRRTVHLEDGSFVTLNTASRIAVRFTPNERAIDLLEGEALFEVAPDRSRPLRVYSAHTVVEDISTRFSVRRHTAWTRVTVTEGRVRLLSNRRHAAVGDAVSGLPTTELTVGDQAVIRGGNGKAALLTRRLSPLELEDAVRWTDGYLQFTSGTPLSEAVEEFNRYNQRQLRIDDPRIADLRVGGHFEATDLENFVASLRAGFPVRVIEPSPAAPIDEPIRLVGHAP